jgi:hypothetical protein
MNIGQVGRRYRFEATWEFGGRGSTYACSPVADLLVIHDVSLMRHRKSDIDCKNDVEVRIRLEFERRFAYSESTEAAFFLATR